MRGVPSPGSDTMGSVGFVMKVFQLTPSPILRSARRSECSLLNISLCVVSMTKSTFSFLRMNSRVPWLGEPSTCLLPNARLTHVDTAADRRLLVLKRVIGLLWLTYTRRVHAPTICLSVYYGRQKRNRAFLLFLPVAFFCPSLLHFGFFRTCGVT